MSKYLLTEEADQDLAEILIRRLGVPGNLRAALEHSESPMCPLWRRKTLRLPARSRGRRRRIENSKVGDGGNEPLIPRPEPCALRERCGDKVRVHVAYAHAHQLMSFEKE